MAEGTPEEEGVELLPLDDEDSPLDAAGQEQVAQNGHLLSALFGKHMLGPPRQGLPDWEVFSLACLARANYSLQTILAIEDREVDCLTLARSVYEHVVTMAWVAIDGPKHYPMHLQWERQERLKMMPELIEFGAVVPADIVNTVKRATIDASQACAPKAAGRALECDRHWPRSLPPEGGWQWHFRGNYTRIFRYCSAFVHPTVMGVDLVVHRHPGAVQLGLPRSAGRSEVAACAVQSFGDGLAVASLRFGWPPMLDLLTAFTTGFVDAGGSDEEEEKRDG